MEPVHVCLGPCVWLGLLCGSACGMLRMGRRLLCWLCWYWLQHRYQKTSAYVHP